MHEGEYTLSHLIRIWPTGPTRSHDLTKSCSEIAVAQGKPVRGLCTLNNSHLHMKINPSDMPIYYMYFMHFYKLQKLLELSVKGPSWLRTIQSFDLIRGMSFDYMHCVLLITCWVLLNLWFNSKNHSELWYIGCAVKEVDQRLCSIQPPNEIKRTPRSIQHSLKYWKGQ